MPANWGGLVGNFIGTWYLRLRADARKEMARSTRSRPRKLNNGKWHTGLLFNVVAVGVDVVVDVVDVDGKAYKVKLQFL